MDKLGAKTLEGKTWGRQCLRCFNVRTRTFSDEDSYLDFCEKHGSKSAKAISKRLVTEAPIRLYWCREEETKLGTVRLRNSPERYAGYSCSLSDLAPVQD